MRVRRILQAVMKRQEVPVPVQLPRSRMESRNWI